MQVYVISGEFRLPNSAPHHIVTGAWKTRPTHEEMEAYIKEVYKGLVDPETGELYPGEFFALEWTLRSNTKTSLRRIKKGNW